jgi:hypothetical protein
LLPAVQAAREAGRRAACQNNLRQLGIALQNFHDTNTYLPPGAEIIGASVNGAAGPNPGTTWMVHILPFIEQNNVYLKYDRTLPYNNATNLAVGNFRVPTYYCPSGSTSLSGNGSEVANGITNFSHHYCGVMGPTGTATLAGTTFTYTVTSGGANGAYSAHGVLGTWSNGVNPRLRLADIKDGTSNTLVIGERSIDEAQFTPAVPNSYRTWVRGQNGGTGSCKNMTNAINSTNYNGSSNFNDISFSSDHPGGTQFSLGDASTRFVNQSVDLNILKAMASRNLREVAALDSQ